MVAFTHSLRVRSLFLVAIVAMLILSACGSSSSTGGTGSQQNKVKLTVGGKLDIEAQLLTKLYTLVLRHAGFDVNEQAAFGNNTIVFNGIRSGKLDLYPEFTGSGLDALKIKSSLDPQKDYNTVKDAFNKQYQITWLDPAPLNDTYAVCTSKANADKLGIKSISDLATKASQLSMAIPSDSFYVLDYLKPAYNISKASFKSIKAVDYAIGFQAVDQKQADLNFCYSTDVTIAQKNFVVLTDDKNAIPAYNPAPIVRNETLSKAPGLKDPLNKLSPLLTNDVSLSLQKTVAEKASSGMTKPQAITETATDFLKSKGLL